MVQKFQVREEVILNGLLNEYGLDVKTISPLSLGADVDTSVYHVRSKDENNYFVKLRRENFSEASATIPSFLSTAGMKQVIPPLVTQNGQLWANIDPFKMTLYPFVEGQPGLDIKMSEQQWFEFGLALKQFHTTHFPRTLTNRIQRERFSPQSRDAVIMHLAQIEEVTHFEPCQVEAAGLLKSKKDEVLDVVRRAEQFAQMLQESPPELILSHGDIHGYNLLIDNNGSLYIVDWDGLLFAPKERDLMFIGGGHGNSGYTPEEEETMFYQGYGEANINEIAMAYFRYERIILDIADDYYLLFLSDEGEEIQAAALEDLNNKFLPDSYIEIAYRSDKVSRH
jgi:spectinomycin phosphotransferase